MARDLAEQERAFILALSSDTGRDLETWMRAIADSGHAARNDIIDWLRHQGFTFSNASWLERIHHNGGRPIYGDALTRALAAERTTAANSPKLDTATIGHTTARESGATPPPDTSNLKQHSVVVQSSAAEPMAVATNDAHLEPSSDADVAALLLAAKGLRPLAEFILREMDQIVPAMVRFTQPPLLILASPMPFAALLPAPKEIRLFADFGPASRDRTRKADSARFPAPFPDVLILNDARQIDDRFRELIALAYTRALT